MEIKFEILTNEQLYTKQYPIEVLEYNVKRYEELTIQEKENSSRLQLYSLLCNQKLDADFCVKYILNEDYQHSNMESYITYSTIYQFQPHITVEDLTKACKQFEKDEQQKD